MAGGKYWESALPGTAVTGVRWRTRALTAGTTFGGRVLCCRGRGVFPVGRGSSPPRGSCLNKGSFPAALLLSPRCFHCLPRKLLAVSLVSGSASGGHVGIWARGRPGGVGRAQYGCPCPVPEGLQVAVPAEQAWSCQGPREARSSDPTRQASLTAEPPGKPNSDGLQDSPPTAAPLTYSQLQGGGAEAPGTPTMKIPS